MYIDIYIYIFTSIYESWLDKDPARKCAQWDYRGSRTEDRESKRQESRIEESRIEESKSPQSRIETWRIEESRIENRRIENRESKNLETKPCQGGFDIYMI